MWITVGTLGANSPLNHTLKRWLSSLCTTRCPSAVTPCPAGRCRWPQQLPLGTIMGVGSQKPCRALLHLSLMPGVSSVRCQRSLRPRASLPLALPSPCLRFHWNGVKRRRVHAGSGTDRQVSWECLSGSQRCSLPSPWLSLRFVALLLSCCYCHPPHTPPTTHQAPRPFLGTLLNPRDSLYRN